MAVTVQRLARIAVNTAAPEVLARFYVDALGFSRMSGEPRVSRALPLSLGSTRLDLVRATGRAYPAVPGWSPLFQHCAIVTADMARALARLENAPGWTAISTDGPERLPQSSGGVVAFKFRDPDDHPLELLEFPDIPARPAGEAGNFFLGIDHSAISVANTPRSMAFYLSLGLKIGAESLNVGPEQERLDAVPGAEVEVTALDLPSDAKPHVELLCYRGTFERDSPPAQLDDIAATRLVFAVESVDALKAIRDRFPDQLILHDGPSALLRDPDNHIVEIEVRRETLT